MIAMAIPLILQAKIIVLMHPETPDRRSPPRIHSLLLKVLDGSV